MNFYDLTETTCYSPVTLAQAVLYGTGSKRVRAQVARSGYKVTDAERKMLVQVASGNKDAFLEFYPQGDGSAEAEIDAIKPSDEGDKEQEEVMV